MKINILKTSLLLAAALSVTACNSFLDEQPSVSSDAPITSVSQLLSLYDYASEFNSHVQEDDYVGANLTDDTGIPTDLYKAAPSQFQAGSMCFYAVESSVMATTIMNNTWSREYSKIFVANTIITNMPSVSGTETEKNEALCNAYFMRAWSLFKLATIYCLPYSEANRSKLGLSLRLGTLFNEDVTRCTLGETFDQILSDLAKADELCAEQNVPSGKAWRVSKCAVYAFYARLYMYMNDYDKALGYADKALALAPALFDYNTLKWGTSQKYPAADGMPEQEIRYCETNSWNMQKIYQWKEWVFIRLQYSGLQWFIPSQQLVDSYDHDNDMRFVYFFNEHGNRRFFVPYDAYRYNPFSDGCYTISGLTTSSIMLDKAECMARKGEWQAALQVLTPLRQARYATGTATPLTATTQQEALKQILAERRREFPFALRLMDIKRFAVSETTDDDVTIDRDFFKVTETGIDDGTPVHITIKGDSPKLAIPVPVLDIQNSKGVIEQNPFE